MESLLATAPPPYVFEKFEELAFLKESELKAALEFVDFFSEVSEQEILRVYDCRPGELKVKRDVAEWLLRAASEIAGIVGYEDLCSQLYKLHKRVQYGVKEDCLKLLQIKGIGRVRARRLINAGVRSVKDYRLLSPENLKRILNSLSESDPDTISSESISSSSISSSQS